MRIVEKVDDILGTELDIKQLEDEIGFELPEDYRRFLMTENGGRPERVSLSFRTDDGESVAVVNFFYTLLDSSIYSLRRRIESFEDRIPPSMIPIANDAFGNQFLLDIGEESGVYFWDHELETEEGYNNVYIIANSFDEFQMMFP